MKKLIFLCFFICGVSVLFCQNALENDPVVGYWVSKDDKTGEYTGGWKMWIENGKLLGTSISVPGKDETVLATKAKKSYSDFPREGNVNEMPILGTPWLYGLNQKSSGVWAGGYIIDPTNGMRYQCKIVFHKADGKKYLVDTLEMRGSLLGIGISQYWPKATKEEAEGVK